MHTLILWCGFVGGWLLFAGPVFQAAVELGEQELERDEIGERMRDLEPPRHPSPWWWLIPPVGYLLQHRARDAYKDRMLAALSPEHREQFVRFSQKATGWLFVAGGALLIATKESYELAEHHHWPGWLLALVIVAMAALSGLNTAVRVRRAREMLGAPDRPDPRSGV